MAAIDKLLQAAISSQMDSVYLEPGRLPRFRRAGNDQDVTQTPLDARAIERLLSEVAPGRRMPDPAATPRWEFDYDIDGLTVHFACLASGAGWSALASLKLAGTVGAPSMTTTGAAFASGTAAPATLPGLGALSDKGRRPMPPVETLMRSMLELGASDLHLVAYQPPHLRLHGELQPFEIYESATSARLKELLFEIAPERHRAEFERINSACFTHEIPDVARFRVRLSRDQLGVGASVRQIPLAVPTSAALDLPAAVERLAEEKQGLVLVVTPASGGRSTLLAALVDLVNARRRCLILTLESPVEFVHERQRALVRQREIPTHAPSIAAALRDARQENVDVVAIGDLVDRADSLAALELAASGTLVLAGVRASSIGTALASLAGASSAGFSEGALDAASVDGSSESARRRLLLASGLRGGVGQLLVPRKDGGRVAVRELLFTTPSISRLLGEGRFEELAAAQSRGSGAGAVHQNEVLAELVSLRQVAAREARFAAADPAALVERLRVIDPSGQLAREAEPAS
ncbi:MAG: ATPase, T2SS/T4P/T4SS family [Thermoanaerobaculia bacterium]